VPEDRFQVNLRLKFVLMQTGKPDTVVAGSAAITVDGLLRGKPSSLSFGQVAPNGASAWHTPSVLSGL